MNIYIISLIATVIVSLICAFFTFKRRSIEGATALFLLMIAVAVFATGYIFEILSRDLPVKLFWYKVEYFGIAAVPLLWLVFSLKYTYVRQKIINRLLFFISLPALFTIILVWTNDFHNLYVSNISIADNPLVPVIIKTNEIGYWIHVGFSYIFIIVGVIILLKTISTLNLFFVKQGLILIIGVLLPILGSVFNVFGINPFDPFDITPSVCAVSGVLLLWSIINLKTFQLLPIARNLFFNEISDGILVLDNEQRIIDINRPMQNILKTGSRQVIGLYLNKVIKDSYLKLSLEDKESTDGEDITILSDDKTNYYLVSKNPVFTRDNKKRGIIISLKNITSRKIIEKELIYSKEKLFNTNSILNQINISENERRIIKISSNALKNIFGISLFGFIYDDGAHEKRIPSDSQIIRLIKENFLSRQAVIEHIRNKEIIFHDLEKDNFGISKDFFEPDEISKMVIIPVMGFGSAVFFLSKYKNLNDEDAELCKLIIGYALETIKKIELQKLLKEQSERDSLTGSYNRRYFDKIIDKEIERAKRYKHLIYFLMIDINRFKEINDRYGHQTGDNVLIEAYEVISRQIRKIDTIIRYGGDEFLVIVPGISRENVEGLIKRINKSVEQWSEKADFADFDINLSIGISSYDPKNQEPIDKILYYADMDMYKNKAKLKSKQT